MIFFEIQGISLCLLAIIPVGLDGRFVSPGAFPVACGTGTWLLTLGHTLAFGAMFSKIWRVHRLANKNKSDSKIVSLLYSVRMTKKQIIYNYAAHSIRQRISIFFFLQFRYICSFIC